MTRVLLINPAHTYYRQSYKASLEGSIGLPLNLLYIGAMLEKKGCNVKILDSLVSEHTVIMRSKDYTYCGIPERMITKILKEFNPDIIGVSNQFSSQEENFLKTAELIKNNINDSILLIAGGTNLSCRGHYIMENSSIDITVKSEGEETISEIMDFYQGNKKLELIKGILYRRNGEIVETENRPFINNLDQIPFPAYHLVDMERYLTLYKKGVYSRDRDVMRNISMITSRGCPYSCIFCSIRQSMGRGWRAHSPEYVSKHIEMLIKNYRIRHIHFEDDNLLFDIDRFSNILEYISKKYISWDTPNGIRVDLSISEEMLEKMRRSGCKSLTIGVESGDEHTLHNIVKKDINLSDVRKFARRCKKVKLPLRAFFILGFPGETIEAMQNTINYAMELLKTHGVEIINMIATPLYGTDLYRICSENKFFSREITPRVLSESIVSDGRCLIETGDFSSNDVERMSKIFTAKVYRRLLLNGLMHPLKSIRRVGNLYILKRTLNRILS